MLVKVFGAAVQGIDATLITIEVNSSRGCMFYLVGLPDSAVKESYQRIRSAIQVNGYKMPTSSITKIKTKRSNLQYGSGRYKKRRICLRFAVGYRYARFQRNGEIG